jgi:hypothetical protein
VISARVRDLSSLTAGAVVSTWGSWTSSTGTQPTYVLGTDGTYEVAFDRTLGQFLDAGTRTFNIGTNEGFTIALQFKFTGTAQTNERLFEVGIPDVNANNALGIATNQLSALRILVGVPGAGFVINLISATLIPRNTWTVVAFRYRRVVGTGYCQYFLNNVLDTEQNIGASTIPNRVASLTYVGRSTWSTSYNFTGSMRFAAMWDRALSDNELTGLYTSLTA